MTSFEKSEVECHSWLLWTRFSRCWNLRQMQFLERLLLKDNAASSFRMFIRRLDEDRCVVMWLDARSLGGLVRLRQMNM